MTSMAIVLPLVADGKLISSAVLIKFDSGFPIFVSTLHQIGTAKEFQIALPPHRGQVSQIQNYPIEGGIPTIKVELLKIDPIHDLSFFKGLTNDTHAPIPNIIDNFSEIEIGEEMLVLGYPYSTLGSVLETTEITHVSAKGRRMFLNTIGVDEIILSHNAHQGSSGSAVVRRKDGALCGIIRGSLTPPNVMSIGDIPLASDSTITYCTFSSIIKKHIQNI